MVRACLDKLGVFYFKKPKILYSIKLNGITYKININGRDISHFNTNLTSNTLFMIYLIYYCFNNMFKP